MKNVIALLLAFTFTNQALAGAPGLGAYFCTSASGKTKLTVVDRYGVDESPTVVLGIRTFVNVYDQNDVGCQYRGSCLTSKMLYTENGPILNVKMGSETLLRVEFYGNGNAKINKGFIHPEHLSPFASDIYLTCQMTEEQI